MTPHILDPVGLIVRTIIKSKIKKQFINQLYNLKIQKL